MSDKSNKQNKNNGRESGRLERFVSRNFTYRDMIEAFNAGRKHMKKCGDTNSDCWDFSTWMQENYG